MSRNDWYNLGNDIRDIVQNAVDTQDFDKLNQAINGAITGAIKTAEEGLKDAGILPDAARYADQTAAAGQPNGTSREAGQNGRSGVSDAGSRGTGAGTEGYARTASGRGAQAAASRRASERTGQRRSSELFASVSNQAAAGIVMMILGWCGVAFFGFWTLIFLIGTIVLFDGAAVVLVLIMAALFAAVLFVAVKGTKKYLRARRFPKYIKALAGKTYANVEDLARFVGKQVKDVQKDLQYMIDKNWFLEGHLDEKKMCLMVTNEVYREYQATANRAKDLEKQKEAAKKAAQESGMTPEVQAAIEEGEAYVRRIRQSNDAIPGVEISAKISRMEMIVQRIFERIAQHPENLSDIRRLMEYYLPTTVKLLGAYEELDRQPVQGENIVNSKKEIEASLDTLNVAFENLLDGLFKDTAWDVSTDISVLHTMLAQEGLTGKDF